MTFPRSFRDVVGTILLSCCWDDVGAIPYRESNIPNIPNIPTQPCNTIGPSFDKPKSLIPPAISWPLTNDVFRSAGISSGCDLEVERRVSLTLPPDLCVFKKGIHGQRGEASEEKRRHNAVWVKSPKRGTTVQKFLLDCIYGNSLIDSSLRLTESIYVPNLTITWSQAIKGERK